MDKLEEAAQTFSICLYRKQKEATKRKQHNPYVSGILDAIGTFCTDAFKAGAEWQKQQSEQNERDKMFAASLIGADMAKSKWISVKDKLPNPGIPVLVRTRNNKFTVTSRDVVRWNWNGSTAFADSITHWMLIPELPKGGEE